MTLAPRPRSTAADLLRLLASWLAAIVLLQSVAAAQALGWGPLHRHVPAQVAQHRHHHDGAEHHRHADASDSATALTVASAEPAFDVAASALVAALALMAFATLHRVDETRHHVWRAAPAWAWLPALTAPLRRPPRRA